MTNHLTSHQISCYCGQKLLAPDERRRLEKHITVCHACREQVCIAGNMNVDVRAFLADLEVEILAEDDHLECEQLVAYVSDKMDEFDRMIADTHLEVCEMCAREVRDLQDYKVSAFTETSILVPAKKVPFSERLFPFRHELNLPRFAYIAGFAIVLSLLLLASFAVLRKQDVAPDTQMAQITSSNQTLERTAVPEQATPSVSVQSESLESIERSDKVSQRNPTSNKQPQRTTRAAEIPALPTQTAVVINDGDGQVTLDAQGRISGLRKTSPELKSTVADALITGRVETTALESVASSSGVTLKGAAEDAEFEVLMPVGTVVMTDQPVFRWQPVKGASSYVVTVVKRGQVQVATSGLLSATTWRPSAGQLQPGIVYRWGVVATLADGTETSAPSPTAPEARFKILEQDRVERIKKSVNRHARSPLLLGVLYAREGLVDDAEREFERLVRQNPRSHFARKLLQSVRGLRTGSSSKEQ